MIDADCFVVPNYRNSSAMTAIVASLRIPIHRDETIFYYLYTLERILNNIID